MQSIVVTNLFVDSEYCSNRNQTVNVWGTIQWIKAHNVFSLSVEKKLINVKIQKREERQEYLFTQACLCTYSLVWFHNDGLLIFLWHQHTGGEGGLNHVNDQVIGQNIQFLHLISRHVGASSNAISNKKERKSRLTFSKCLFHS